MKIADFTAARAERALTLIKAGYAEERSAVPALPPEPTLPDLSAFAGDGVSAAAVEGGELRGFLCFLKPWESGGGKRVWSPLHAHGAAVEDRREIYARLYEFAAERLANLGVTRCAVTLYAHDADALNAFFDDGFGCAVTDAIRLNEPIGVAKTAKTAKDAGVTCRMANEADAERISELNNGLVEHLRRSPMFLPYQPNFTGGIIKQYMASGREFAVAERNGEIAGYMRLQADGENFICGDEKMSNVSGAFVVPEERGKGVADILLAFIADTLRQRGITRLGVDFETNNRAARGFWLKHFTRYTKSVVRIVMNNNY